MILDITQSKESVEVSYVTEDNKIELETIIFDSAQITGINGETYIREFHNFVECGETDPNRNHKLTSFYGKPIKLEPSKRFTHHNVNYFLNYEIPHFYPKQAEILGKLVLPNMFSVDIETDITDEYGYSNEETADNPIRSISFTDENFSTLLFIVKNPKHPDFNDLDYGYIRNILQEALGHHYNSNPYEFKIRVFDNETEMLNYYIDCNLKYFHAMIGWNFLKFDIRYILKRCERLGLDIKRASPNRKLVNTRIEINEANHIDIKIPAHRLYIDYMTVFKESLVYGNLGKYNLDSIADMVLKLKKVTYDGNLRTLYETDYLRFVAYALVDTIIVMMLHKTTNLLGVDFFNSYYTGCPYNKLGQNMISEALVYNELIGDNIFLLESEKSTLPSRPYQGGYVKDPTGKIVDGVAGYDFGSLYPNSMITCGISPEAKIDVLHCGPDGFPDNPADMEKWKKYKALGYCLSPMGRVYDVSKDFLFTRIEKKLLGERKHYRRFEDDIYLDLLPRIEAAIKARGLEIPH